MLERPAETRNAADRSQVKGARQRARRREERYLAAVREVLSTTAGQIVIGELELGLLARGGLYRSPFNPSGSETYRNIGRLEFAQDLLALCHQAGEEYYLAMEKTCRDLAARDARETEAAHTASATEGDDG